MNTSIEAEVEKLLEEIRQDPARFASYDLDGNGHLDEAEEERLRSFLTAQVRTERALRGEREDNPLAPSVERIAGRYVIIRELGAGGQARTYLALDEQTEQEVVVKQLHLAHLENWKAIELFEREGEVLAQLDHARIPSYLGAYHEEEDEVARFLLIQEYLEGPTLAELLESGRRFREDEIKAMLASLLEILVYLQTKNPPVIHRDIKPSNIIQGADGSWSLIDFGAIQAVLTTASMIGSTIVGTSGYMAPEQFMGRSVPATDLYALGATAVHALSHVHPAQMPLQRMRLDFHGRVNISPGLRDFLDRLLDPNVEDRFEDARQALAALQAIDRQLVATPPTPQAAQATATAAQSQGARAALVAAGLLVAVAIAVVVFIAPESNPHPHDIDPPDIKIAMPEVSSPVQEFLNDEPASVEQRFANIDIEVVNKVSSLEKMTLESKSIDTHYNNEASVGFSILNGSKQDIEQLKADIHIMDAKGKILAGDTEDIHQGYKPPLRPGDMTHFDARLPISEDAKKIVITLVSAKSAPTSNTYEDGKPFAVGWVGAQPDGIKLEATPRLDKSETPLYGKAGTVDHKLELAVKNTGTKKLRTVKLEKRIYDKKGEMILSEDSYLNGVYDPPLDPGDTLLISLDSSRHAPFERYEIVVSDYKLD
jgi:serine/threonine protein kinase